MIVHLTSGVNVFSDTKPRAHADTSQAAPHKNRVHVLNAAPLEFSFGNSRDNSREDPDIDGLQSVMEQPCLFETDFIGL